MTDMIKEIIIFTQNNCHLCDLAKYAANDLMSLSGVKVSFVDLTFESSAKFHENYALYNSYTKDNKLPLVVVIFGNDVQEILSGERGAYFMHGMATASDLTFKQIQRDGERKM